MANVKSMKKTIKNDTLWRRIISCWPLYVFLLPAVAVTVIFKYVPMYGIQIAFKDFMPGMDMSDAAFVGFRHFMRFFSLNNCKTLIYNTFKIGFLSQMIIFPLPIIFALMLNQVRHIRFKKAVQNISYMPYLFSIVIVMSVAKIFLAPNTGIINILIQKFGGEQVLFFGHDKYVLPIYIITGLWQGLGYSAIIYIATLSGIDQEQIEAAQIDGAGRLRIIWSIELPALADTIVIMLILTFGQIFTVGVDKMLLLQTPLNINASEVLSTYVYKVGLEGSQFSFSTAVELFNTLVNLFTLLIVNKIAQRLSDNSIF